MQRGKDHTHEPDEVEIEVQEVVRSMKRRAREQPNAPPSSIFRDELARVQDNEVISNLPQRNDVIRTLNRVQNRNRPNNPQSLDDLIINPPYTTTFNGERFLQFDSRFDGDGEDLGDRFLMFYTRNSLEKLCASRIILCDGTFKTVPHMFYQLYSIHGVVRDFTFPLVYVLATRKDEHFYTSILNRLKHHALEIHQELSPQYISSDFEISFLNAARVTFPSSTLHGCLFHFNQSLWRYAVNLGLKTPFADRTNNQIRQAIQCLMALPFVPLEDVLETFDLIVNRCTLTENDAHYVSVHELFSYVQRIYVRGVTARGRRRAVPPRFPPQLWNVYELVLNKQQRTTNSVESWHSRFQRMIQSHHSGVWKFLENIQKDENENQVIITQLDGGHTRVRHPVRGSVKRNQEQVEVIVGNYQNYKSEDNIVTYLLAIGYKLKLKEAVVEEQFNEQMDDEE